MADLSVFQALWAMENLGRGWSRDEELERIAEAGFAGVEIIADPRLVEEVAPRLDRLGLGCSLVAFPDGPAALGPALDLAAGPGPGTSTCRARCALPGPSRRRRWCGPGGTPAMMPASRSSSRRIGTG